MARLAPGERHDTIAAVLRNYGWRTAAFYPAGRLLHRLEEAEDLRRHELRLRVRQVRVHRRPAPRRSAARLLRHRQARSARSSGSTSSSRTSPTSRTKGSPFGAGDIDRYDSEIAYTDAAVGRLVKEVRARRPGTIVIVAADHGEEFDEHGGRYHGSSLYDEQLRIPLIISIPGVPPRVVDGQVELFDVTPTVLNLLDISVPVRMRGTDLGPWLATPPAPAARLPPAFAELEDKRMVSLAGEKLICDCARLLRLLRPDDRSARAPQPRRGATRAGRRPARPARRLAGRPPAARAVCSRSGGVERGGRRRSPRRSSAGAWAISRRARAGGAAQQPPRPSRSGERPPSFWSVCRRSPRRRRRWRARRGIPTACSPTGPRSGRSASETERAAHASRRSSATARRRADLRVRAALALATVGDGSGIPVLAEALDRHDDILLCRFIIVTLGKLGDRRAVPILLTHLPEVQNRREMVEALGALGDPAAVPALVESLQHDAYVPVRAAAAKALAQIGRSAGKNDGGAGAKHLIAVLTEAARHDTEPMVIAAARAAAASLKARP